MATNTRYRSPNGSARPYRDGTRWKVRLSETLPNGRDVTAIGSGASQPKAIARAKKNLAKKVTAALAPPGADLQTVGGWCQHWLTKIKASDIRYKTIVSYQHAIDAHIAPVIGDVTLSDLAIEDVDELHRTWTESGLAGSSWVAIRTVLKQALDVAVRRGHMATNPALYAPHAPRTQSSPQVLSEDEARVLLTSCSLPSEKCRLMSALVLGLRQGEVLGLQWADMDLDSTIPTVRVERTLRRETGRGLITGPPKTQKSRRILRLPPELVSYLRVHRTHQMKYLLSIGVPMTGCSHVFATGFGTPMDPANDRKTWLSMLDRAGLRRVRLHAARHTCATLMINGGTDIAVVSSVLGHSTIATTADIYGHVAGATAGEALRKISGQVTA